MRHPGVMTLLCGFTCHPVGSFVLRPSGESMFSPPAARLGRRRGFVRGRPGRGVRAREKASRTRDQHSAFKLRRSRFPSAIAAAAASAAQSAEETAAGPVTLLFESSEAVSCFRNADTGSEMWLVGCYHRGKPSVELVEDVVRTVKPRVVMLELDARRVGLLPKGEAHKGDEGLWWWTPYQSDLGKPQQVEKRRRNTSSDSGERGEQGVEFVAAAVAAQACGARVLLGDRDLEEILRRQAEAKSADEKQAAKPSDKRRRAGLDMDKLEGLIARRSALGQEVPVTREIMRKWSAAMKRLRPREHAANVTERDEVMANNLMQLKGNNITTVAVVGFGHLDGIEKILKAEGWEPVRD